MNVTRRKTIMMTTNTDGSTTAIITSMTNTIAMIISAMATITRITMMHTIADTVTITRRWL